MQTTDGRLYVIAGASRTGKTAWTAKHVKKSRRVIAYDPDEQWCQLPGWQRIETHAELLAATSQKGPARIAFIPGLDLHKSFQYFCKCALRWGRKFGPCDIVAEELADVTSASKAPGQWGLLLRRGLKRGISVYAISQRWAEADKTAMGNASLFVCFMMATGDDISYMARKTRIPVPELEILKPLEFVTFDTATKNISRSRLTFSR